MTPSIQLRDLTKDFATTDGVVHAVRQLDLDIGAGEIVAVLGPNGAGKTTTLDMILGFTTPTSGHVGVLGRSPREAVADGRMSAVLQTGGLLRDLTVGETVQLIASTYTAPPTVAEVLARTGLTDRASRLVQACSGGEQQRLRFALALLADPDIMLFDEPTAGMDVDARQTFWSAMSEEADRGRTIVFATHYLQEAEDFARRTILLANGRVVADGPTDLVRGRAAGRTVRARLDAATIGRAADTLERRSDVVSLTVDGDRLAIETSESDQIARLLLGELGGTDLEISAASLEHAFVQLTRPVEGARS